MLEGVEYSGVDEPVVGGGSGAPDDRGDHFDNPAGPAGTPTREGPPPPGPIPGVSSPRPAPDSSRARRFPVERADGRYAFD